MAKGHFKVFCEGIKRNDGWWRKHTYFLKKISRTWVLFVGPLIPLFWTSGDVSSGFGYHAATHSVRSGRPDALPTELSRLGSIQISWILFPNFYTVFYFSRNWHSQYNDVYRKLMNNQQHICIFDQWRIYIVKFWTDFKGAPGMYPSGGPNSFNFMQFSEILAKSYVGALPESWHPHLGEILDPPLLTLITI